MQQNMESLEQKSSSNYNKTVNFALNHEKHQLRKVLYIWKLLLRLDMNQNFTKLVSCSQNELI